LTCYYDSLECFKLIFPKSDAKSQYGSDILQRCVLYSKQKGNETIEQFMLDRSITLTNRYLEKDFRKW
jgi:predicted adenine nucleotide alpha hydrolase (AANH) superfamily ATPase